MASRYIVEIQAVRELNLVGGADLDFWAAHLAGTGLAPRNVDGRAELSLGCTDLAWLGVRFNESIIVLSLAEAAAPQAAQGGYLVHAFNSNGALAWMERAFFRTPYYPARIQLGAPLPAGFQVSDRAGGLLRAAPSGQGPALPSDDAWEGAVHLPRQRIAPQGHGGYFYARLAGPGAVRPFVPGKDAFTVTPGPASPALEWLRASGFTPREWRWRPAAVHAKSRTYPAQRE